MERAHQSLDPSDSRYLTTAFRAGELFALAGDNERAAQYYQTVADEASGSLQEKATAVVAQDYADMLHGEFPSLSDDLVREARAAVAAAIELNWAELAAAENVRTKEVEFAEQVIAMNDERFRQAGVAPDLAEKVAHRTAMWGYYDGLKATLPGLKRSVNAKLKLFVTMPAPISGGNADVVDGNTATFLLDLGRTVAEPVTLEVVCEP